MKVEEYIKENVSLSGYGSIENVDLNKGWFEEQEKEFGEIADVFPIDNAIGGNVINSFCSGLSLKGCIIVFKSGMIMAIESDDEYVDWFIVNKQVKT